MKLNKDDIYGIAGSVAFHLFILLILGFTVLRTVVPDEDGGILVNFDRSCSAGTFRTLNIPAQEPPEETTTPPPPVPQPKVETPKEELITQDMEESVAIEEAKKKKEKEELRKKEEEKKRKEESRKRTYPAKRKPRRNASPKSAVRKNRPSATRSQELSAWEVRKGTARGMPNQEPATKAARSAIPTTEPMKAWEATAHST